MWWTNIRFVRTYPEEALATYVNEQLVLRRSDDSRKVIVIKTCDFPSYSSLSTYESYAEI